jgi:hypothetical protein
MEQKDAEEDDRPPPAPPPSWTQRQQQQRRRHWGRRSRRPASSSPRQAQLGNPAVSTDLVRSFQRRAAGHHNKHIFVALIVPSECVLPFDEYPPPPTTTTTRLRVLYHQIPDEDTVVVLPSLEIKTKLAADRVNTALSLITRHGKDYFTVRGGDSLFYAVVPNEYRGQLLHQAAVLRLNYVLFMLARTSGVLYRVRV